MKKFDGLSSVISEAKKLSVKYKMAGKGDKIVITAGIPFGKSGGTNLLIAQTI